MVQPLVSLQYYNDTISSSIGIFSNMLAIYIVRKRTSIAMRQYSQTLLQNCVIDLFCNIVILATREVYDVNSGYLFLIVNGFASHVSQPWDILVHMLYCFTTNFCFIVMVVPFYVRYKVLYKNDFLSFRRVLMYYLIIGVIAMFYTCLVGLVISFNSDDSSQVYKILRNSIFIDEYGRVPIFHAISIKNPYFIFLIFVCLLMTSIAYMLIFWLGIQFNKGLQSKKVKMLASVCRFHREINRVLIIQAITPVVAGFFTITGGIILLVFEIQIDGLMILLMMPTSWMCVVNPFFAIFMVRTYRKAIFHPFNNKIWKVKTPVAFINDK